MVWGYVMSMHSRTSCFFECGCSGSTASNLGFGLEKRTLPWVGNRVFEECPIWFPSSLISMACFEHEKFVCCFKLVVEPCDWTPRKIGGVGPKTAIFGPFPRGLGYVRTKPSPTQKKQELSPTQKLTPPRLNHPQHDFEFMLKTLG